MDGSQGLRSVSTADFLLELRSEEIPARMQKGARDDLGRLFLAELDKAGIGRLDVQLWSTPRRLALVAPGPRVVTQMPTVLVMRA